MGEGKYTADNAKVKKPAMLKFHLCFLVIIGIFDVFYTVNRVNP